MEPPAKQRMPLATVKNGPHTGFRKNSQSGGSVRTLGCPKSGAKGTRPPRFAAKTALELHRLSPCVVTQVITVLRICFDVLRDVTVLAAMLAPATNTILSPVSSFPDVPRRFRTKADLREPSHGVSA